MVSYCNIITKYICIGQTDDDDYDTYLGIYPPLTQD